MRTESEIEAQVLAALEATGLPYTLIECDPADADTARFCVRYGYPPSRCGNTIIVATRREPRRYAACIVRADRRLDVNHRVRDLLGGDKLSFAPPEETGHLTGMLLGGVTVLALPPELPIFVDGALMELDSVILGSGSRSAKIDVTPEVFRRLPGAQIVDDLAREVPAAD